MERSHSRDSRAWKSDSSDTEYWFPPPKFVGDEFQQEYNRQHSQEELQVSVLSCIDCVRGRACCSEYHGGQAVFMSAQR